jgi:hypothetical protein
MMKRFGVMKGAAAGMAALLCCAALVGAAALGGCEQGTDPALIFVPNETPDAAPNEEGGGFVPVTWIKGVPRTAVKGSAVNLSAAAAVPENATNKTLVWSVKNAGTTGVSTADLASGIFTPANTGTLVLTASVADGAAAGTPYTRDYTAIVTETVTGIDFSRIETENDLLSLANGEPGYPLDGAYYLAGNIPLTAAKWTPIGTAEDPFTGIFNGNGYTISNLRLPGDAADSGLFGYVSGARIENVKIVLPARAAETDVVVPIAYDFYDKAGAVTGNATKQAIKLSSTAAQNIGGLAGYAVASRLSDITVEGELSVTESSDVAVNVGGVIGTGNTHTDISNVHSAVTVFLDHPSTAAALSAYSSVGGLVGSSDSSTVRGSSASGEVTLRSAKSNSYAGGLAGNAGILIESHAAGTVDAASTTASYFIVGGLAGISSGAIIGCTYNRDGRADKKVIALCSSTMYVGGLIGQAKISGQDTIENSYAKGDVSLIRTGDYSTSFHIGGLIGLLSDGIAPLGTGAIKKNYATGAVTATPRLKSGVNMQSVGGLIGEVNALTGVLSIEDSYAQVDVTLNRASLGSNTNATVNVNKGISIGGLIGAIDYASTTVNRCYASGDIVVDAKSLLNVGGLVGYERKPGVAIKESAALSEKLEAATDGATTSPITINRVAGIKISGATIANTIARSAMDVKSSTDDGGSYSPVSQAGGTYTNEQGYPVTGITRAIFEDEDTLDWDFGTVWVWDGAKGLPALK